MARAIELFDKAIPLANTELEMVSLQFVLLHLLHVLHLLHLLHLLPPQGHLFGLRDAAQAQITVSTKLGISLPPMGMMG